MNKPLQQTVAALALCLTLTGAAGASAAEPRLYADSALVQRGRISVEVIGHGPDLILIPGLASSRETWRATTARLKDRYRLHLVQVNGFAGAPVGENASGAVLVPVAEAIDAYIKQQRLAPATVIAHSMGGTIVLWLAENHPETLKRALVVDALPFFAMVMAGPGATVEQARAIGEPMRASTTPMPAAARTRMVAAMVTGAQDRLMVEKWSGDSDPSVVARAMADDIELDLRPGLSAIHTPITLLYPDNAPVGAPAGAMDRMYGAAFAAAGSIKPVRIDNSEHFIMLDQPAAYDRAVDAFLR